MFPLRRRFVSVLFWFCLGILLFGLVSCLPSSIEQSPDLKIGVVFPLTGDAASYGEKGQKAIELAVEEINAKATEQDRKVTAIYEDSRAEPKTGVSAVQKLVTTDKVPVIVSDIVSAVTLAIAPIVETNQVVLISPTSSAPAITDAGEFVFRIWPSDLVEGKAIAELAVKQGYKKAAILHLNNDYGTAIADIFKKTFEGEGRQVVLMEGYLETATDFRSVLSKIAQATPDVIYVAGYFADTARILKQAKELGIQPQFLGTTAIEDNKFLELAGNAAEGLIYPLASGFDPASPTNPKAKAFAENFQKKYGYEPGWVEAHAYDAFMLADTAANSIQGEVTGTEIKKYLDNMGEYDGVTGKIKFDQNGDVVKPVTFKIVRDGKFQALEGEK